MRTIEASGKTIDEAIFNGLKELEVSIDEVEIGTASIHKIRMHFFLPHIQKTVIPVHRHRSPFYNNDKIKQVLKAQP